MKKNKNIRYYFIPFFTLLFIALPVLSTMETADPGAEEVLAIVIPTMLYGMSYMRLRLKPYHISAVIMWLLCSIVTLLGPFASDINLMQIIKYLAFVIFFIFASSYKFKAKDIIFITKGYILISIAIAVLIILSYIGGYQHVDPNSAGGTSLYLGRYSIGITGRFKNPNYLASFICVAALFILYKMKVSSFALRKQVFYLGIFFLFFVSCFLTGTRASLMVLLIVVIALYGSEVLNFSTRGIVIPLLFVCIVVSLYGKQIANMFDLYLAGRDMLSDYGRENAWKLAYKYIYDNILLGSGIDSWLHLNHGQAILYLHNVFLEFLLNQGVIGALLLVYTLLYGFRNAKETDSLFLFLLFIITAIPISFQNGVIAVNFWRFIIINRLALNYSIQSEEGITALFKASKTKKTREISKKINI